jgi:hypothetical protein
MTQVKKASPVGRKFESQYDTIENRIEMRTAGSVSYARLGNCVLHTKEWEADEEVRDHEGGWAVEAIGSLFGEVCAVF